MRYINLHLHYITLHYTQPSQVNVCLLFCMAFNSSRNISRICRTRLRLRCKIYYPNIKIMPHAWYRLYTYSMCWFVARWCTAGHSHPSNANDVEARKLRATMRHQVTTVRAQPGQVLASAMRSAAPDVRQQLGRPDSTRRTLRRYAQFWWREWCFTLSNALLEYVAHKLTVWNAQRHYGQCRSV